MPSEIIWSKPAVIGYLEILQYIDAHWTSQEVEKFEKGVSDFFETLRNQPYLLKLSHKTGIRKGPINKLTIVSYRLDEKKNQIQVLSVRSARQIPH